MTIFDPRGAGEQMTLAGSAEQRTAVDAPPHVRLRPAGLHRLFLALKWCLRLAVRAVYLFPLLLVVKFICHASGAAWGELITVVFVALVVSLFLLLALLVLLYPAVGPPSRRRPRPRLVDLDESALSQLGLQQVALTPSTELAASAAPPPTSRSPLRLSGVVDGGETPAPGVALLQDRWAAAGGAVAGLFVGRTIAVLDEKRPPVIVELQGPALLLVPPRHEPLPPLAAPARQRVEGWLAPLALDGLDLAVVGGGRAYDLHHGERVELWATAWQPVVDLDGLQIQGRPAPAAWVGPASGPYRGHQGVRAIVVRSTPDHPVVLRRLPS